MPVSHSERQFISHSKSQFISSSESQFILSGFKQDIRGDGRKRNEARTITISTSVVPLANGSCRATLVSTNGTTTDVLVGVKCQIGFVDWTIASSQDEEGAGRGMIIKGRRKAKKGGRILCTVANDERDERLSAILNEVYGSSASCIDFDALEIVPGLRCWVVHVDAIILDSSAGNVFDVLSLAVRSALVDTRIPKTKGIQVFDDIAEQATTQSTSFRTETRALDFEIYDNEIGIPLPFLKTEPYGPPISITLNVIAHPSTPIYFIDATIEEESVVQSLLHIFVSPSGRIVAMDKSGPGPIGSPNFVKELLASAKKYAAGNYRDLLSFST